MHTLAIPEDAPLEGLSQGLAAPDTGVRDPESSADADVAAAANADADADADADGAACADSTARASAGVVSLPPPLATLEDGASDDSHDGKAAAPDALRSAPVHV
jgi:hypothetical protein